MAVDRGFGARLRYKSDEFISGGAGRQLMFLFVLTMVLVIFFAIVSAILSFIEPTVAAPGSGSFFGNALDRMWHFWGRFLDAGTMGGDEGQLNRFVSSIATIIGVIVAGLLISSLAGNFTERLEQIKRGSGPVLEEKHFLILGWSEKIYSVIDQLTEAYVKKGQITVVVMAEGDKIQMEEALRDKVVHQDRCKIVVRSGSSVSLVDLAKVSFERAQAIVVLLDEKDAEDPNRADGRIIKTLMALYNHPDAKGRIDNIKVTAEVMMPENQDIAVIASNGRAQVIKTNEIISKIILQTSRISGLSFVYDELLRFEGNEIHYTFVPQCVGRMFGETLLHFPNGCVVGVAKRDGSSHILNPAADYVIQPDDELLILAEDDHIPLVPYQGPLRLDQIQVPQASADKPVEHMLVLGWNEKIFPIISEFDDYVGAGSSLTIISNIPQADREAEIADKCGTLEKTSVRHVEGEFTSRALMEEIQPQVYPTVMVLGQSGTGGAEEADTKAIIALLLMRDSRRRAGIAHQKVCSEILDPKNRDLAATTEIHDIVISNEMISMILAQITYEPRVRPVLEDVFRSEGSEIYLKDLRLYAPPGQAVSFEYLILAAKARGEVALGVQVANDDPARRYGIFLNPVQQLRVTPITPKAGDRLIVLAEDDG